MLKTKMNPAGRKQSGILLICFLFFTSAYSQTEDSLITRLFGDSYHTVKLMRQDNGVYLDALSLGIYEKPAAIAANGVGLISLCIADSMYKKTSDAINWEANGAELVNNTLQRFINFKNNGATNANGLFRRYFDYTDGSEDGGWGTEYSTIDNAIFAMGLVFCKNYFHNDTEIGNKVNYLLHDMEFTAAISDNGSQLYMALEQGGNGIFPTGAFNEYMLVAWLAKNVSPSDPGYQKARAYWDTYYDDPLTSSISRPDYWGYELISDHGGFISHFIPQFTYYYCQHFRNNDDYLAYFNNFRKADSLFWTKKCPGIPAYEWGLGAGENPGGGYSANAIDNNDDEIISPPIIAGFLPVYGQGRDDLKSLLNPGPAVYSMPDDTTRKVLWRYSRINPDERCEYIQAVDFSTMLYGLASLPEFLGDDFFSAFNTVTWEEPLGTATTQSYSFGTGAGILSVYPNPTSGFLTINTHQSKVLRIEILNEAGLVLQTYLPSKNEDHIQLDISDYPRGLYLLKFTTCRGVEMYTVMKD
jgi:hypothetical protein